MANDITVKKLEKFDELYDNATATTLATANAKYSFIVEGRDYKHIILLKNDTSADAVLTVYKGDSVYASKDLTLTIPTKTTKALSLEMAGFKVLSGLNKGKVFLSSGTANAISVQVYCLPN